EINVERRMLRKKVWGISPRVERTREHLGARQPEIEVLIEEACIGLHQVMSQCVNVVPRKWLSNVRHLHRCRSRLDVYDRIRVHEPAGRLEPLLRDLDFVCRLFSKTRCDDDALPEGDASTLRANTKDPD